MVGVLVLVYQNVAELALVKRSYIWEVAEQMHGFGYQVVEVEGIVAPKFGLVALKDFADHAVNRV